MTPPDYDDLCKRLRNISEPRRICIEGEAADAIESLREQVDHIKQVEFPAKIDTVCKTWRERAEKAEADNAALLGLLIEWEDGMYDGMDFLRRVRLAIHGRKGLIDAAMREGKG